ncbi:MAG: DNA polymerase III subunit delta' [Pseudomonadota bacterium]
MSPPYPWQAQQWRSLTQAVGAQLLGHAYLFSGPQGVGKTDFSHRFVDFLLCDHNRACGACRSCELLGAGNHPDLALVAPEEEGKGLNVDQIRRVRDFFTLTAHFGNRKIALIEHADAMNIAAANALLKILEEPPDGGHLFLLADRPGRLPPTIRSRCVQLNFPKPSLTDTQGWLNDELGREAPPTLGFETPLKHLERLREQSVDLVAKVINLAAGLATHKLTLFEAVDALKECPIDDVFDAVLTTSYLTELERLSLPTRHSPPVTAQRQQLQVIAKSLNSAASFAQIDEIITARRERAAIAGLRDTDLIERLCLGWMTTSRRPTDHKTL